MRVGAAGEARVRQTYLCYLPGAKIMLLGEALSLLLSSMSLCQLLSLSEKRTLKEGADSIKLHYPLRHIHRS